MGQLTFPAGTITAQPPGTLAPNPMDSLTDNQLGGEEVEEAPELPPPTELVVDQPPGTPVAVTVETHRMSLQWTPVSVTVKSNEIRVVEYLLEYKLEMQQLEGNSSSTDPVPLIEDGCWWTQVGVGGERTHTLLSESHAAAAAACHGLLGGAPECKLRGIYLVATQNSLCAARLPLPAVPGHRNLRASEWPAAGAPLCCARGMRACGDR